VPVIDINRGEFLRFGVGGLVATTSVGILAAPGAARVPTPTPVEDDIAFLSFAAIAERTSRDFYRAAVKQKGTGLEGGPRRHLGRVASAKRAHIQRLDGALGADAPLTEDFQTILPPDAVKTAARIFELGAQLETLLVGVYLNGVGYAQDSSTRLLLGRLLIYDAQQLTWLHGSAGRLSPAGLQGPIDLEPAAEQLDAFLSTPDFPDSAGRNGA
jgi:hypothetical protein